MCLHRPTRKLTRKHVCPCLRLPQHAACQSQQQRQLSSGAISSNCRSSVNGDGPNGGPTGGDGFYRDMAAAEARR